MNARDVALVVLAKAPCPGRVKTRLCPPCTPGDAAALAAAALADTLASVAATDARRRFLVLDGRPGRWVPPGFTVVPQEGHGLGERLGAAFAAVRGPAVLVGMDTPQLTPSLLGAAAASLARPGRDAVLGLACDGGYWCIGLREPDARVFAGVPMSTASTGDVQFARLRELGLVVELVPRLRDVDVFDDALAVAGEIPGSRFASTLASIAGQWVT